MHTIQSAPICIYWRTQGTMAPSWSIVLFHEDFKQLTFSEFCLYIIIPKVEDLQSKGFDVKFGYVADDDYRDGLENYKKFLELEIEYERNSSSL